MEGAHVMDEEAREARWQFYRFGVGSIYAHAKLKFSPPLLPLLTRVSE